MTTPKSKIDLSLWNLEDVFILDVDAIEKNILKLAAWVVEHTITDTGNHGLYCDFKFREKGEGDPLDLQIAYPCLDDDYGDGVITNLNLRDFVFLEMIEEEIEETREIYGPRYLKIAKALHEYASEIEALC